MIFGVFLLFFLRNKFVRLNEIIFELNGLFFIEFVAFGFEIWDEIIDAIKKS